ncbi:MAG: hypothetical protein CM1200mP1_01320 [Candidatus Neomarinimicrobiota bacterium]|nr:MAG: hypothetical protein CM1200mP1_01320 [Candidatus Neomarinimicrobiota bacterium]
MNFFYDMEKNSYNKNRVTFGFDFPKGKLGLLLSIINTILLFQMKNGHPHLRVWFSK